MNRREKNILRIAAVLIFIANAYIVVETAMLLGAVVDTLIAGEFKLFQEKILLLTACSALSFFLPVMGFQIAYSLSCREMIRLKEAKFISDLYRDGKTADLSDYSQNLDMVYSGILLNRWNFLNIGCTFVFTVFRVGSFSILLLLIAFAASALPLLIPALLQRSLTERSGAFLESSEKYLSFVKDKLGGRSELLRYDGVQWAAKKHSRLSGEQEFGRKRFRFANILGNTVSEGMGGIAQVLILFAGGIFVFRGIIQIGETVTLLQLMNYMAGPVAAMVSLINSYISSSPAYKKLKEAGRPEKTEPAELSEKRREQGILLRNVELAYGSRKIFEKLNLRFEDKKSYLIAGASGCGKSSLLKLIAGELEPDGGEISLFGFETEGLGLEGRAGLISYVSQDTYLFEDSVGENIAFGQEGASTEIDRMLGFLQLGIGREEKLGHDREVSGGEKKRIGLARAFLKPKEILLLDEITNGLDHELAMEITKKILGLHKTVLFVSHEEAEDFRELFDCVIDLNERKNDREEALDEIVNA